MIKDTYMLGVFPVTGCQSKTTVLFICIRKFWELTWTPPQKSTPKWDLGSTSWRYMCYLKGLYVTWYDCYTQGKQHRIFGLWVVICLWSIKFWVSLGVSQRNVSAGIFEKSLIWNFPEIGDRKRHTNYQSILELQLASLPGSTYTWVAARRSEAGNPLIEDDWWELRKIPWFDTLP